MQNGIHSGPKPKCRLTCFARERAGANHYDAGADLAQRLVADAPGAEQHEQRAVRAVAHKVDGVLVVLNQERLCGRASVPGAPGCVGYIIGNTSLGLSHH